MYLAPDIGDDVGMFAVYSYPWVPELDTPILINSMASEFSIFPKNPVFHDVKKCIPVKLSGEKKLRSIFLTRDVKQKF